MYANQGKEITIPNVDCNQEQVIQDTEMRYRKRTTYPGACLHDYQAAVLVVCNFRMGP